jgi:hypothetical protein
MKALRKLLLVIACAGVTGTAAGTMLTLADDVGLIGSAWAELKLAFDPGDPSARNTETTGAARREGVPYAAAAAHEPSEWLQLVCGIAFVAFMARRRAGAPAD